MIEDEISDFKTNLFTFLYIMNNQSKIDFRQFKIKMIFIVVFKISLLGWIYQQILADKFQQQSTNLLWNNILLNFIFSSNYRLNPFIYIILSILGITIIILPIYIILKTKKMSYSINDIQNMKNMQILQTFQGFFQFYGILIFLIPLNKNINMNLKYLSKFDSSIFVIITKLIYFLIFLTVSGYSLIINYFGFKEDFSKENVYNHRNNNFHFISYLKTFLLVIILKLNQFVQGYKFSEHFYLFYLGIFVTLTYFEFKRIKEYPFYFSKVNSILQVCLIFEILLFGIYYSNCIQYINEMLFFDNENYLHLVLIVFFLKIAISYVKKETKNYYQSLEKINNQSLKTLIQFFEQFKDFKNFAQSLNETKKPQFNLKYIYLAGYIKKHLLNCKTLSCYCHNFLSLSNSNKNIHFDEQVKTLRSFFFEKILIQNFINSLFQKVQIHDFDVKLIYMRIQLSYFNKFIESITILEQLKSTDLDLLKQFRLFSYKQVMIQRIRQNNLKKTEKSIYKMNLNKIFNFNEYFYNMRHYSVQYLNTLEKLYYHVDNFRIDLKLVEQINHNLIKYQNKYQENYQKISKSIKVQKFHLYFNVQFVFLQEFKLKNINIKSKVNLYLEKYRFIEKGGYLIINTEEKTLGQIQNANLIASKILGFPLSYLKNLHLNNILPFTISIQHQQVMRNYIKNGIVKMNHSGQLVYFCGKNKFLLQVLLKNKLYFDFTQSSCFFAAFFIKQKGKYLILCNQMGKIEGISENLFDVLQWKSFMSIQDNFIQTIMPNSFEFFDNIEKIQAENSFSAQQQLQDFVQQQFKLNKLQNGFKTKLYLDPINSLIELKLNNLLYLFNKQKDAKKKKKELTLYKNKLNSYLKYATKKVYIIFDIEVIKTQLGYIVVFIIKDVIQINKKTHIGNLKVVKQMYQIILLRLLLKKIFRKKNKILTKFKLKKMKIKSKKFFYNKTIKSKIIKQIQNFNSKKFDKIQPINNFSKHNFLQQIFSKNYVPFIFKIKDIINRFVFILFILLLIYMIFFLTRTKTKFHNITKFDYLETKLLNSIMSLNFLIELKQQQQNSFTNNNNQFYQFLQNNFIDNISQNNPIFFQKYLNSKQIKENLYDIHSDCGEIMFKMNFYDSLMKNYFQIQQFFRNQKCFNRIENFLSVIPLQKSFYDDDSKINQYLMLFFYENILLIMIVFLVVCFSIICSTIIEIKQNQYFNETFELSGLIKRNKDYSLSLKNFVKLFKLEQLSFQIPWNITQDKYDFMSNNKKFIKIKINYKKIILYNILRLLFYLMILAFFFLVTYQLNKHLQQSLALDANIQKLDLYILMNFNQIIYPHKKQIVIQFDEIQKTFKTISKLIYETNLGHIIIQTDHFCKNNPTNIICSDQKNITSFDYEIFISMIILNQNHIIKALFMFGDKYDQYKIIIFDILKLFFQSLIDQKKILSEYNQYYENKFRKGQVVFIPIFILFLIIVLVRFFVLHKQKLKQLQRLKKIKNILKFIPHQKFYTNSKLKIFINKNSNQQIIIILKIIINYD